MSSPTADAPPASGLSPVTAPVIKPPRLAWSNARLKTLLHLRIVTYGAAFSRNNARAQLTRLWTKIQRSFNRKHKLNAEVEKIKNKFNSVKALFGQIKAAEAATGNDETPINYPSYWELLVQYFGDKKGLSNQDFGQSGVALPEFPGVSPDSEGTCDLGGGTTVTLLADSESEAAPGEYSDGEGSHDEGDLADDGGSDASDAHDGGVAAEAERHDTMRNKRKLDLPEALVTMGSTLAAALAAPEHTTELASVSMQLAKIQKTQELMVNAIEESRKVNAALLEFLSKNTQQQ